MRSMWNYPRVEFATLVGKTILSIKGGVGDDEIEFNLDDNSSINLQHDQDCCESVVLVDIIGDLNDLLNTPVLSAEEITSENKPEDIAKPEYEPEYQTWTFYKIQTIKGSVTLRWQGQSNGYYSESVTVRRISDETTPA